MKSPSTAAKKKSTPQYHIAEETNKQDLKKIVIVGNPNVGKSLLFNRLTGIYVTVSNYPGTTVTVDKGNRKINGKDFGVVDLPGIYSLIPLTEEERVAKLVLLEEKPSVVLHVIDGKNLERMLPLSIQLIEANLPVVVVVNMMDEAKKLGIHIDFNELESKLGVPVVPVIATTGQGIDVLMTTIGNYDKRPLQVRALYQKNLESSIKEVESCLQAVYPISKRAAALLLLQEDNDMKRIAKDKEGGNYDKVNEMVKSITGKFNHPISYFISMGLQKEVKKILALALKIHASKKMDIGEKLSRVMIHPITGIPILIAILYFGLYQFVGVFGAGNLVDLVEGTIFGEWINPFVISFILEAVPWKPVQDLLVGEYGIVTLGITYAVAIILPIVGTFFLVFSVIEDTGYLPRLSLLVDRIFKKIGLSGRAIIPMVLGLGCGTMATMVTRTQETNRERVISTLLLALTVPCSAQLGVIFAILANRQWALLVWFIVLFGNFILVGFLTSKILPGENPRFYMELPPLRLPRISNVFTKTYTRMVWYFKEVFPLFLLVSFLIWIFDLIGFFHIIIERIQPVMAFLGLPKEAANVFLFGFFRRDYGAAGLYSIQDTLTGVQLTVAAVTLTLFVPCIAQLMMMIKERGMKTALLMFTFVFFFAFGMGFIVNQVLTFWGVQL